MDLFGNQAPCRACKAPMIWAKTESGKNMPVDADPTEDGKFVLVEDGETLTAVHVSKAANYGAEDGERYTSHFVTCPKAERFR